MERNMHAYELPPLGIRVFYEAHGNILSQRALPEVYYSHKHTYFELHVMEYGCVSFEVGGQTLKLCGGDFCLVYPGTVHVPAREQAEVVRGSLGFEMTDAKGKMSELLLHKCQQGDYFCGRSETLAADWHRLREETVSSGPLGEEMVSALLSQLLICMIRTMQSVAEVPAEEKNTLDQLRTVYIDTFLNNRFFCLRESRCWQRNWVCPEDSWTGYFRNCMGKATGKG